MYSKSRAKIFEAHKQFLLLFGMSFIGGLSSAGAVCFDPPTQTADQRLALGLMAGGTESGCFDEQKQNEIVSQIGLIRNQIPSLATVATKRSRVEPLLNMGFTREGSFSSTEIQRLSQFLESTSPSTIRVKNLFDDWNVLEVVFPKPRDTVKLLRMIESQKILQNFEYNGYMGIGSHDEVYRIQFEGALPGYVFRDTSRENDCESGCRGNYSYVRLQRNSDTGPLSAVLIPIDQSKDYESESYWALPSRFHYKIFRDAQDLAQKLQSPKWTERVHAVAVVNGILKGGDSCRYGEDCVDWDRLKLMVNEVRSNAGVWQKRLAQIATNDPDLLVRTAAISLESIEYTRKEIEAQTIHKPE